MSKMVLESVVVSLVPEMAPHPALNTVNQITAHDSQGFVSHHVNFTEEKYLQVVRSVATCRYTRDPTSYLVESLMVSRKALQCRMEPRRTHKDTVLTSVVWNVEDGTRIIGGQLAIRDGSAPCTQHSKPVGTPESVDGQMLKPSKAM